MTTPLTPMRIGDQLIDHGDGDDAARDSGTTREGPAYAVHQMTESRLVILQP